MLLCDITRAHESVSSEASLQKDSPATAAGTVRLSAVTVATAICSGVYFLVQLCPGVTMFGFRRVPSRKM